MIKSTKANPPQPNPRDRRRRSDGRTYMLPYPPFPLIFQHTHIRTHTRTHMKMLLLVLLLAYVPSLPVSASVLSPSCLVY